MGTSINLPSGGTPNTLVGPAAVNMYAIPGVHPVSVSTAFINANLDQFYQILVEGTLTFDQVALEITTASGSAGSVARVALYTATTSGQPAALVEDFGTVATDSTGVKTLAPSGGSRTLPAGRYVAVVNGSAGSPAARSVRGQVSGGMIIAALGSTPLPSSMTRARAHAAFGPSNPGWNTAAAASTPTDNILFYRVTAVS